MTINARLSVKVGELPNDATILVLSGEIDLDTGPLVVRQFQELADRDLTDVIIDARQVSFIDSAGLHALVEGKRIIHDRGSQIVLVPSRSIRQLLELTFPEPLFAARADNMEEALTMFDHHG